jgi:hypothetical protein
MLGLCQRERKEKQKYGEGRKKLRNDESDVWIRS